MKFSVCRTSSRVGGSLDAPCLGAYQEDDGCWSVDINSLEELIRFIGRLSKASEILLDDQLNIEIYDDYRE